MSYYRTIFSSSNKLLREFTTINLIIGKTTDESYT
jgi:hypothetical protein